MVAPIRATTGINTKLLVALELGVPLVATAAAAAPFRSVAAAAATTAAAAATADADDADAAIAVADDAAGFASRVLRLYTQQATPLLATSYYSLLTT